MKTLLNYLKIISSAFLFFAIYTQDSLNFKIVGIWNDTTIPPDWQGIKYGHIWGYSTQDKEYAIISTNKGIYIIDITLPANPITVVHIYDSTLSPYTDLKTYSHYLYAGGYTNYLHIFDLQYLPDSAPRVYSSDTLTMHHIHNIFIDSATQKIYFASHECVVISSISNPKIPKHISDFCPNYGHIHDVHVRNDTGFVNVGVGLLIVNFTNSYAPNIWDTFNNYPSPNYNNWGWWSSNGKVYAFTEEAPGRPVYLLDLSNFNSPVVASTLFSNISPAYSMAKEIIMKGDTIFVAHTMDGIYAYDISNPYLPKLLGFYDTSPLVADGVSYGGVWGAYSFLPSGRLIVSDMQRGLIILEWAPTSSSSETVNSSYKKMQFYKKGNNLCLQFPELFTGNIYIYDVHGRKLISITLENRNFIEVPMHLNSGVFFIQAISDNAELYIGKISNI